jgi:glutathione S-transferase
MQTSLNDNPLAALLALPAVDRTRRNHALEHATLTVLSQKHRPVRLMGRSTPSGFHIYGDISTEALLEAATEALRRLQAGEASLAVHPNCGTNFVIAGCAAACAAYLGFVGANRWRDRWERMPVVALLSTLAVIAAQPVALAIQRNITTSGDVRTLQITRVERRSGGTLVMHFVATEG